jgi:hypothetical protein
MERRGEKIQESWAKYSGSSLSLLAALNAKLQLKLSTLKTCRTDRGHTRQPRTQNRGHNRLLLGLRAQLAALQTGGTRQPSHTDRQLAKEPAINNNGHARQPSQTGRSTSGSTAKLNRGHSRTDRGHNRQPWHKDRGHTSHPSHTDRGARQAAHPYRGHTRQPSHTEQGPQPYR